MSTIEIQYDETHPTCGDRGLYWDPEFLANLKYCVAHAPELSGKPLKQVDLDHLRAEAGAPPPPLSPAAWAAFKIPVPDTHSNVEAQTQYVRETFLQ